MRKHKKHLTAEAPESRFSEKAGLSDIENRPGGDDSKSQGHAKKEINGIWIAGFLLGLFNIDLFLALVATIAL